MKYINRTINKKQIQKTISWSFTKYGTARTALLADKLKDLGFKFATRGGVSISVEDLQVPASKKRLLEAAEKEIRDAEESYVKGEITEVERFQKVIDTWNQTSEDLKNEVVKNFEETDRLNSVYMMAFSGARGNISQVRQLVGMRGLMADPQGEIIDLPIKTNFREGLTVTEYIISSYGARKGLVDTALRTADSGYLTRRLVDVSQDVIVRETDCGTQRGLRRTAMTDPLSGKILIPLSDRLLGRVIGADVIHPVTGEVLAVRNQEVDEDLAHRIENSGVTELLVRSPLTCESNRSVCQRCYGWSLAHGHTVDMGEAIGIIAAQSIGEPGTQLTMRTFHTGGVFTGEVAEQVKAKTIGKVVWEPTKLKTRNYRTRHGQESLIAENNGTIEIHSQPSNDAPESTSQLQITQGSVIFVNNGDLVKVGDIIAEVPKAGRTTRKTTEKAVKDVTCDLSGETRFDNLPTEDRTDRQGNITRIASRGGLIWVLSGEVYNLPTGAEAIVKNGDRIDPLSPLAAAKTTTEHGGKVRIKSLESSAGTERSRNDEIPRDIEIITASVVLDKAIVRLETQAGREHYVIDTPNGQKFALKVTPGSKITDREVLAELIDDRYRTNTGGLLKYAGVEVQKRTKAKQGNEVLKGGSLLWIPEECHEVNKDSTLLRVEEGQYVEAGTEIVRDIFCQTSGLVEVVQKNDILREITIKPGELVTLDNPELSISGAFYYPGQEIIPGRLATELVYVETVESTEGPALLIRPVQEFVVPDNPPIPSQESSINQASPEINTITLRAVQRLPFKDGDRIKSVEGIELLRTQLVPEIGRNAAQLAADIELLPEIDKEGEFKLQLVILESLVIRRDVLADPTQGSTRTQLLVKDGDEIAPGATVARTEILSKDGGVIHGIASDSEVARRILLVRNQDTMNLEVAGLPPSSLHPGQLLIAGTEIAPGVTIPDSGQVVSSVSLDKDDPPHPLNKGESDPTQQRTLLTLRLGRPYRVSPGAILHVEDGDLVQRGDNLVLLVFERAKTGDIIQGLPRIEELLEARRPKESCMLAKRPGIAQVINRDDDSVEVRVVEDDGTISEYPLTMGRSCVVSDGQRVEVGEPLTDGPSNPHEILEVFFNYYREFETAYQAALKSFQACQTFLVNEVQSVYQSQGIDISDKHVEVIVRQMTNKVRIEDGGDSTTLPGELVELRQVELANEMASVVGNASALYTPVLLGITKASLNTDSFISAASFQETTKILTEAAIEGKSDWLRGLKENVIIGRLIPAGTGFSAYQEMTNLELGYDPSYQDDDDYGSYLDEEPRPYDFSAFAEEAEDEDEEGVSPIAGDIAVAESIDDEVDEVEEEVADEDDYDEYGDEY